MLSKCADHLRLSNNQLKLIAMLSMLLDHIGLQLFPTFRILRILGRISFPIFAYMIAEGCAHTRNRTRYLLQILVLGVGCQAVFTLVTGTLYQGILITFSLAILSVFCIDLLALEKRTPIRLLLGLALAGLAFVTFAAPVLFEAQGFALDYGAWGVILPVLIYYTPGKRYRLLGVTLVLVLRGILYGGVTWFALLSVPLLLLYSGERGGANLKYLFYIFYPSHLVLVYAIDFLLTK